MGIAVRKTLVQIEETLTEMGRPVDGAKLKLAVGVVMTNPAAGRYLDDLAPLVDLGAELGALLVGKAAAALGDRIADVSGYGKGAIVGSRGELEHAAALIHPKFGAPVRARLGRGPAIIPSTKKLGGCGASITVPITHCDDIWQFDQMDAIEFVAADGPRDDEIVVVLALSIGGRPLHRIRPVR